MKSPSEPIDKISIVMLTWKTVFLVAICSAKRISEMQAFDCRPAFCTVDENGVVLRAHSRFLPIHSPVRNLEQRRIEFTPYGRKPDGSLQP